MLISGSMTHLTAIVLVTIMLLMVNDCSAKIYTRCELAKTLYRTYKFSRSSLGDWVCLIEAQSGRNTRLLSPPNPNGSKQYGLFQINSFYFCSGGAASKHNECKVSCSALLNDNIADDVKCAKFIYNRQNFNAWYGWISKCKGKNVNSYVANCKL